MIGKRLFIIALVFAILPALAITIPTSEAEARNGRKGAFVAGLVVGAVGAAILYDQSQRRYVRNHYHRNYYGRCHTHNGVRHCHQGRKPTKVRYSRYEPWSRAWYRYCLNKYRSFNPKTGYYRTYGGKLRFCR